MLQQQISSAQLHNLAAVQQVTIIISWLHTQYSRMEILSKALCLFLSSRQATLAASRQSNTPSNSMSQAPTTVSFMSVIFEVVHILFWNINAIGKK